MTYTKKNLEVHSFLSGLHERYGDRDFIHFDKTPEILGTRYLETIIGAIEERQVLRITYLPFYEDKAYYNDVHPYLLKEYEFRWYLVGWNSFKESLRTYALDRIRNLEPSRDIPYRDPGFQRSEYFRYALGIIAPGGAPPLIKMAVQRTQAQYLITQPWHESQNIHREEEDRIVFSFRVHPTYEFRSRVMGLGRDAEVLEPVSLRESLKKELLSMTRMYES